ncbi:metal-dependent transcriptional regulator [Sphingobacterium sp. HMA12]|uniref:metal-dependent transcriptional regulator n=1 Tax=Sphingobacterium sp. HMA12 TaxID=2050894 RepID=UPI001F1D4DF4|nr:iron dependent repressor, metal binding and dimerization domain protein [Sphingobacterium sp. HMA12]
MKRLAEKGLIVYESYKLIRLTESTQKEAAFVIRKHQLTEVYFAAKMGFRWEAVHATSHCSTYFPNRSLALISSSFKYRGINKTK